MPVDCPTHHFSYTSLSYTLFVLHIICPKHYLSYTSFVLHFICPKHNFSYTLFVLHIICPTHHFSYTLFVLHIICPTHHLSYSSFVLHIICPTHHLDKWCVGKMINRTNERGIVWRALFIIFYWYNKNISQRMEANSRCPRILLTLFSLFRAGQPK